jgi:ankyrin repeat protein
MKRTLLYLLVASVVLVGAVTGYEMFRDWRERPADYFVEGPSLALAEALMADDEPGMRALIGNGADIDAKGVDGITLLQWQVSRGDYGRVRRLLALGADPDIVGWGKETATHLAAFRDNPAMLELLLDGGADPNATGRRLGRTPIFNALAAKNARNVELLIERGGDVFYRDTSGSTLLHYTAGTNYFKYVLRFLELGVDPLALDDLGFSFQPAFFGTDPTIMNANALAIRRRVTEILVSRGIELDPAGENYRK